ncbi:MAG: transcriptional regulator, LysR family [Cyanobacteria bacterium RYN_339]|nr:transcriptional regulator, LysR family [Cyanobacteria bacterium RYN_339]
MELDQLRTFLLAAELQSFTQAARRLSFSQSAISQQIRDLEDRLGVRLFERHSRSVSLTPAGEILRPRARQILDEVERATEALSEFRGLPQGVVRIAASTSPGIYLLPHALGRFSEAYPGVRASLEVPGQDELVHMLQQGDLDLAVVEENLLPSRVFGWEKLPALEDEIVLIAPPDHPLVGKGPLAPETLAEVPMIMRPPENPTRQVIHNALASAGFNPGRLRVRFEIGNTEGLKRAVLAGLGLGFASSYAIASELEHGTLVVLPLAGVTITRVIWLVRPAKQRSPMPERFADLFLRGEWLPANMHGLTRRVDVPGTV